uniref:Uncharacterized protein n=1 Tax=Moniliophthora roreri TaxID=221103 RepID=A0A0W0ETQ7_MONRR
MAKKKKNNDSNMPLIPVDTDGYTDCPNCKKRIQVGTAPEYNLQQHQKSNKCRRQAERVEKAKKRIPGCDLTKMWDPTVLAARTIPPKVKAPVMVHSYASTTDNHMAGPSSPSLNGFDVCQVAPTMSSALPKAPLATTHSPQAPELSNQNASQSRFHDFLIQLPNLNLNNLPEGTEHNEIAAFADDPRDIVIGDEYDGDHCCKM